MPLTTNKYRTGFVYLGLAIIPLAVFFQVHSFDLLNYDDQKYVTENPQVYTGLTFDNYRSAFIAPHFFMWHPMTSLSHMLDCELFGLNPGHHHLVNLLFHIANTLLLFTVLRIMTGSFWPSAFVAALFAVHPLNVESVAWVAERKTVLSTFFSFLAIAAYIRYVKHPKILNYLLIIFVFALAVMSKPSVVTLPFVLLLLDYWPLNRFQWSKFIRRSFSEGGQELFDAGYKKQTTWRLIKEKIPLFLLSLALCVLTMLAQGGGNVLRLNNYFPFSVRLANALVSYSSYITKMVYPVNLAVFYQHPGFGIPLWKPILSFFFLAAVSAGVIYLGRRKGYLVIGWLWFLGTLVPMIGLVQAGGQSMADRYAYFSLIGLFIIIVFGADDLLSNLRFRRIVLGVSSAAVILVLSVSAFFQVGHWRNGQTLFEHALKVTGPTYVARMGLFGALLSQNKLADIMDDWNSAIQDKPDCAAKSADAGTVGSEFNKWQEAVNTYTQAIKSAPDLPEPYNNLGAAYGELGCYKEAVQCFEQAIKIKPDYIEACDNIGIAFERLGCYQEAVEAYMYIVKIKPDFAGVYNKLGANLGQIGQYFKAIEMFLEAIKLSPSDIEAYNNIGITCNRLGKLQDAILVFEEAIKIKPDDPRAYYGLALVYLKMDDKESARKQYETLKALDAEKAKMLLNLINK